MSGVAQQAYSEWLRSSRFQPVAKEYRLRGQTSEALTRIRIEETSSVPPTSDVLVQLMTAGCMTYQGDYGAGRISGPMRQGDFGVAPAGAHLFNEGQGRCEFLVLALPGERVRAQVHTATGREAGDLGRLHAQLNRDTRISSLLLWLWEDIDHGSPHGKLYADATLDMVVSRLITLSELRRSVSRGGLAPWQVRRICDRLQSDLSADPGLAELAALVGLSPEHVCRAFKASTGLPPHAWLVARRGERVCELLEATSLPIEEIAAEVGYAEPSHLARMFRRAYGVSPSQYRRERRS